MADEKYLTRPKTKPAETLKGKLNKWDNGYAEFIPQGQKPSNRSMLKQVGGNSFYKTADGRFAIDVVANPYVERYGLYAKKPYYYTMVADKPEGPYTRVEGERPAAAAKSY